MMVSKKIMNKYPQLLLGLFALFWIFMAISPTYRNVWLAENILTVFLVLLLVFTYNKFRFSNLSYTLVFLFMLMHTVGSHFSYSGVPLGFLGDLFGRNHYDRMAHFLFGVVFYFPILEYVSAKLKIKGWWKYFIPFVIIVAMKGVYEVLEVGYHLVWERSEITTNFLGMQGDIWDAQKDIFLGIVGAGLGWLIAWWKENI